MKILITGGAGFIGSNLAEYFNEHDPSCEVRILDDLSTGRLSNLDGADVSFTEGSVLDGLALAAVMDGVDSVVHLAAIGSVPRSVLAPRPTHDANVTGTLNVLEAAREANVDHVVVASSSSVYGSNPALPKSESDWTRPMSPYGVSKLATEGYALAYNHSYGMKTLAFRFFNVFGPKQPADHDYAAVIPKFLAAAFAGQPLVLHGDGEQSRDFTFVDTVCSAIYHAAINQVTSNDPVNLAYGTNTSLLELIALIERELGVGLETAHTKARVGDVKASQADGIRIRELFPDVSPVSLEDGLRSTVAWFRETSGKSLHK